MRDSSLLLKCEAFLLHPTVRTLSLAQRVDFLEKKGLTPAEIAQCLTSLTQRDGLSQVVRRPITESIARAFGGRSSIGTATSPRQLLQFVLQKYGIVALLVACLGVSYAHWKGKNGEQLILQHEAETTQRQQRQHTRVAALLAVVNDQQMQYKQAAKLLETRATRCIDAAQAAQKAQGIQVAEAAGVDAAATSLTALSATQSTRRSELRALKMEMLELRSAIVNSCLQSPVAAKVVDDKELLRPADVAATNRLKEKDVQEKTVITKRLTSCDSAIGARYMKAEEARPMMPEWVGSNDIQRSRTKDQTAMNSGEITELFELGQTQEQLSAAGSYRLLFTT
ncbi:unnamed protein product [Hyaloperonospora brassicae]|uniref:Peroxisome membrane anchor protein Pex14p N-terminal domain-containing protein n=1 Tax=Hyaloperonospora brassicae TaxID=162125 RepID=A0AAV0UR06_HYABA|nr:unnamed protein product [Hyaloperonospora brassicae]